MPIVAPVVGLPKLISMDQVACEVDQRVAKSTEIVLRGVNHLPPLTNIGIVTNHLRNELGVDATVICCTRLGKLANVIRSSLLLLRTASVCYITEDAPRPNYGGFGGINNDGIAFIYRNVFAPCLVTIPVHSTSFELLVYFMNMAFKKLILANIFRPSSQIVSEIFFEEFICLR